MCLGLWSRGKKLGWTLQNLDCSSCSVLWLKERGSLKGRQLPYWDWLLVKPILTLYIVPKVQLLLLADTLVFWVAPQPQSPGWQVQNRAVGHQDVTLIILPLTKLPFLRCSTFLTSFSCQGSPFILAGCLACHQTDQWLNIYSIPVFSSGTDEVWDSESWDLLLRPHSTILRFWTPNPHSFLVCAHWFAGHPWGR